MDGSARVHDTATGTTLHEITGLHGADRAIHAPVALSPDGRRLGVVAWVQDRPGAAFAFEVRLYEVGTAGGATSLGRHPWPVRALAFNPSGSLLASASEDLTTKLWDVAANREQLTLRGHTSKVNAVAFGPDGRDVATASDDETMRVWEVATGREMLTARPGLGPLTAVTFALDGSHVATGLREAIVYELTGLGFRLRVDLVSPLDSVAINGTRQAGGLSNGIAYLLDARSGRLERSWLGQYVVGSEKGGDGRPSGVRRIPLKANILRFSSDGTTLAAGAGGYRNASSSDYPILLWDVPSLLGDRQPSPSPRRTLAGHPAEVTAIDFDRSGRWIASGDRAGVFQVHGLEGRGVTRRVTRPDGAVVGIAFLRGAEVAAAWSSGRVEVFDAADGRSLRMAYRVPRIGAMIATGDGSGLVVGCGDGSILMLDAAQPGRVLLRAGRGHDEGVTALAIGGGGAFLVSGGGDRRVLLRDARTLEVVLSLPPHGTAVKGLALGDEGSLRLAICGHEQQLTLYDLDLARAELAKLGLGWEASSKPR
jgi:WD40 repeat protein